MSKKHYAGKRILITGASSGIGKHLAIQFAKEGAELVLCGRNMMAMEAVRGDLPSGSIAHIQFLDLNNHALIPKVVENVLTNIGTIDVLVNNGGISQRSLVMETDFKVIKKIMDINFFGTIQLTKCLLPSMIKNGGGHIVTITSLTAKFSTPFRSAYAASKHALHGWFDALRAELHDQNVRVSLVCPGFVNTGLAKRALVGDGSENGKADVHNYKGLSPAQFAIKVLPYIKREKSEIYIAGREILGVYLKRFLPRIFERIIRKTPVR